MSEAPSESIIHHNIVMLVEGTNEYDEFQDGEGAFINWVVVSEGTFFGNGVVVLIKE